jgi:hypothetical protein
MGFGDSLSLGGEATSGSECILAFALFALFVALVCFRHCR